MKEGNDKQTQQKWHLVFLEKVKKNGKGLARLRKKKGEESDEIRKERGNITTAL